MATGDIVAIDVAVEIVSAVGVADEPTEGVLVGVAVRAGVGVGVRVVLEVALLLEGVRVGVAVASGG